MADTSLSNSKTLPKADLREAFGGASVPLRFPEADGAQFLLSSGINSLRLPHAERPLGESGPVWVLLKLFHIRCVLKIDK